ncbi:hypothetical protein ACFXTH_002553 [Malus domestica]
MQYLDNPNGKHSHRTRVHATNYVTYQNELYRKGEDGLLLLCLGPQESARAIKEVHEGDAELINPDGKCDGYFDGTAIFGREY